MNLIKLEKSQKNWENLQKTKENAQKSLKHVTWQILPNFGFFCFKIHCTTIFLLQVIAVIIENHAQIKGISQTWKQFEEFSYSNAHIA